MSIKIEDIKDCENCCSCESMAPRIECLQAQISQLTEMNGNLSLAMKTLLAVPMVKNFLPEEELDKIDGLLGDD